MCKTLIYSGRIGVKTIYLTFFHELHLQIFCFEDRKETASPFYIHLISH
jgi:hypothetical protein